MNPAPQPHGLRPCPKTQCHRTCLILLISLVVGTSTARAAEPPKQPLPVSVTSYFKQYCYRCHGETTQKGDRRLDQFSPAPAADHDQMTLLEEALDAMNRGEMPPKKKGVLRPPVKQTRETIAAITSYLAPCLNRIGPHVHGHASSESLRICQHDARPVGHSP